MKNPPKMLTNRQDNLLLKEKSQSLLHLRLALRPDDWYWVRRLPDRHARLA